MKDENTFHLKHAQPLTKALMFVAVTLILDGVLHLIFENWVRSIHYPVDPFEAMVQIFIGVSLLSNLVFSRFLVILYCIMAFFGSPSFLDLEWNIPVLKSWQFLKPFIMPFVAGF